MKKHSSLLFFIAVIIILITIGVVFAVIKTYDKPSASLNDYSLHAETVIADEKTVNVQKLLEDLCAKETFKEKYLQKASSSEIEFEDINVYPEIYYLKYFSSDKFREKLSKTNTSKLSDDMFSGSAEIYLPVFAKIDGDEHIIATIRIYFDSRDKTYHAIESEINADYDADEHFFKKTERIIKENQITECIWVYDSKIEGYTHSSILLVEINGAYKIYDYENIFGSQAFTPDFYDVEDYIKNKNEYEAKNKSDYPDAMNYILILLFISCAAAITVIIYIKKYKEK